MRILRRYGIVAPRGPFGYSTNSARTSVTRSTLAMVAFAAVACGDSSAAPSPTLVDKIVMVTANQGPQEVGVIGADGSGYTILTTASPGVFSATASPDGRRIAYTVGTAQLTDQIVIANSDGSNPVNISAPIRMYETQIEWSPDGRQIALACADPSDGELRPCVINIDGSGLHTIGYHDMFGANPTWSPDGRRLAFDCRSLAHPVAFSGYRVCIAAIDGTSIAQIPNTEAGRDEKPNWSRAVNKIAFHRGTGGLGADGIFVADADGANAHLVTLSGNEPAWSPDGSQLSYTFTYSDSPSQPHSTIYVVNANGGNAHLVSANWSFESSWFPARVP
ncbi:MAG: hypothetical protein M3081_06395 [Gemmatimonadota bacterium]|nr:hypothetical protein [Gemmatimonadota bacterium]